MKADRLIGQRHPYSEGARLSRVQVAEKASGTQLADKPSGTLVDKVSRKPVGATSSLRNWGIKGNRHSLGICAILFLSLLLSINLEPGTEVLPYVVTLALQLGVCVIVLSVAKIPTLSQTKIISMLILFSVMLWFSTTALFSDYTLLSFSRFLLAFIPGFGLYLLTLLDRKPIQTFTRVLKGLLWFGVGFALIGILISLLGTENTTEEGFVQQVSLGGLTISQLTIPANGYDRISSLLGNPNNLGFMVFLSLMATFTLRALGKLHGAWLIPLTLIQLTALFMTFSRANMLTFIVASFLLFLLFSKNTVHLLKRMYVALMILILMGIAVLQFFPFEMLDAFNRSSGLAGREDSWAVALDQVQHHAVSGIGFAVAEQELLRAGLDISTHNSHLSVMLETGLLGYTLFFAFWCFGLWSVGRHLLATKLKKENTLIEQDHLNRQNQQTKQHEQTKKHQQKPQQRETIIVYSTVLTLLLAMFFHQLFETKIPYAGVPTLMWFYFLGLATKRLDR
ncbi:O-antigen ligase family protein [Bacillus horti]|uniref:O-antigen ligase n=1 Tax=Caldalkalibacillus horti TaxID=77523 RepID=A0ABT9VZH1_9BACI|nr:O-antigen ligase family protein [Bacillus horti]MDQ0166377.1 O-antigen ligase [Bacillus horti]